MKITYKPRQSGKTTDLIKKSAKNNIAIVTHNLEEVKRIKHMANELNLTIPEPLTYNRLLKSLPSNKKQKVYFDDIEILSSRHGFELVEATANSYDD
jgi:hypothetical protein